MNIISHNVNGLTVGQRQSDGFINGTAMCVAHGKDISDWLKTDDTLELVVALADDLGVKPNSAKKPDSVKTRVSATYPTLVIVKRGSPEAGGGTWLHPDLALQLAQHCSKPFAIQVSRWIRNWMSTGTNPVQPQNNGQPYWYRRLMLYRAKTKIPVGWFSIFEETISLIGDLEARGYVMPDTMIPDISIGKCWANHLRGLGYNVSVIARTYRHYYPDWAKPVDANIYSVDLLPIFKRWFEAQYKPEKMVKYFKKADARALPSVCKLLGLPEGKK